MMKKRKIRLNRNQKQKSKAGVAESDPMTTPKKRKITKPLPQSPASAQSAKSGVQQSPASSVPQSPGSASNHLIQALAQSPGSLAQLRSQLDMLDRMGGGGVEEIEKSLAGAKETPSVVVKALPAAPAGDGERDSIEEPAGDGERASIEEPAAAQ